MNKKLHNSRAWVGLVLGLAFGACDSADEGPGASDPISRDDSSDGTRPSGTGDNGTTDSPAPQTSDDQGPIIGPLPNGGSATGDAGAGDDETCASANSDAELQELALAFAFDVSGSMGEGDFPYHDKALKWDPVVAASQAFFEAEDTVRVSASMVFFPTEDRDRCDVDQYANPDVPLQALPSTAFAEAIDEVYPDRGGTPTRAVLQATIDYVRGLIEDGSTAKHAIVLVTDGMPQGCSDETDSVEAVAELVSDISDEVPVYVIGIANPITEDEPNPPDNVTGLHQIASAGGTDSAFIIDTGNPTQTVADFDEVIQSIRSTGLTCDLAIPEPPPGQSFDDNLVNVSVKSGGAVSELVFSRDCEEENAWRYDDEEQPTRIVLCDATCDLTKSLADVELQVEFGCKRRTSQVK